MYKCVSGIHFVSLFLWFKYSCINVLVVYILSLFLWFKYSCINVLGVYILSLFLWFKYSCINVLGVYILSVSMIKYSCINVLVAYIVSLFLRFFIWMLKLFWECDSFCFSFHCSINSCFSSEFRNIRLQCIFKRSENRKEIYQNRNFNPSHGRTHQRYSY